MKTICAVSRKLCFATKKRLNSEWHLLQKQIKEKNNIWKKSNTGLSCCKRAFFYAKNMMPIPLGKGGIQKK